MNDSVLVGVVKCVGDSFDEAQSVLPGKPPSVLELLPERTGVHVIGNEKECPRRSVLADVTRGDDPRVRKPRRKTRLVEEAGLGFQIGQGRDDLDRYGPVQERIARLIDDARPPSADLLEYRVPAQSPWCRGRVHPRIFARQRPARHRRRARSRMTLRRISLETRGHVLLVGLDRAAKRNAFDLQMYAELGRALGDLQRDDRLLPDELHPRLEL